MDFRPSILGIHQAAGVTKKTKRLGRKAVPSAKARRRQERGLDRAAAVIERTAQKMQRSKTQSRAIQERSKAWTEINSRIVQEAGLDKQKQSQLGMFGALAGEEGEAEAEAGVDSGDEAVRQFYGDNNLDEAMGEAAAVAGLPAAVPLAALATADAEDEIL